MKLSEIWLVIYLVIVNCNLLSAGSNGRIPEEYESTGGHSLGFGHGGVAAVSGQQSVRANPAMMVFEKKYSISAGYHWPSLGREFYQAGIVDAKTSDFAAGVTYTSALSPYKAMDELETTEEKKNALYDSPIQKRVSIAAAHAFQNFSLGIGVSIVNATQIDWLGSEADKTIKGTSLTLGGAGLLLKNLRVSLSAENLANQKIKDFSPLIYRAGLAFVMYNGDITAHIDYKQRERVLAEYYILDEKGEGVIDAGNRQAKNDEEKMIIASFSARVQNLIRILGAFSESLTPKFPRRTISGGVAVVNQGFSLSYLLSRPYYKDTKLHQAINLSLTVAL